MRRTFSVLASFALVLLVGCGGGGGTAGSGSLPVSVTTPTPSPTPTPTPTPISSPAGTYAGCPGSAASQAATSAAALFSVTYARAAQGSVQFAERAHGLHVVRHLSFDRLATAGDVLSVPAAQLRFAYAAMRAQPGVTRVARVSYRRRASAAALPDNDPYYNGFGPGAPFYESATVPGQWDMHVIDVAQAWGYSAPNSTGLTFYGAVQGAPIAIVDTGYDADAFEFGGTKVVVTKCFVTWNGAQTTGTDVTDTDGHGSEMAGIAAADTDNGVGFAGVGHDSLLLIYRVYPTDPSGGCRVNPQSTQCGAASVDVASAVNDAVASGARVIDLSMASPPPAGETCAQSDPMESSAIENAIAAGVVVVAAAGNDGKQQIDCPAANAGVIAVGASALRDADASSVTEYVPAYSNRGSGSAWGIVAPGGDPSSSADPDYLHWIVALYSTHAADLPSSGCTHLEGDTTDCVALDYGTSQAAAHVAGAAALIAGARPAYSPSQIFGMLCAGADDIGDPAQGCGRLNVYRGFAAAVRDASP